MTRSPWTSVWKPSRDPRVRLLCLPYAGGAASVYKPWSDIMPPEIEVHSIQLPGRESRILEPPLRRVEPVVRALLEVVESLSDRPIALFGHSLGALLSFELARGMRRAGMDEPVRLFASAHRAPQLEPTEPPVHDASDEDFLASLRALRGTPKPLIENQDLMRMLLPALRADFEIAATYEHEPEPPLDCPISAMGAWADLVTPPERLKPWADLTTGSFSLRLFPGDHFFINESRHLVLRAIVDDLMAARS